MEIKANRSKLWWLTDLPILTSLALAAVIILPNAFPTVSESSSKNAGVRYFYINHLSAKVQSLAPIFLICGLLVVVFCLVKKRPRWYLPLVSCVVSGPIALIAMVGASGFAETQFVGSIQTKDGKEFCVTYLYWLDPTMDMGELVEDWGLVKRYRVVVDSGVSEQDKSVIFALPSTLPKESYLAVAPNGFVVNIWDDGESTVAYDPATGTAYTSESQYDNGEPKGRKVTELSPFMLLGPNDKPASTDVRKLIPPEGFSKTQIATIAAEVNNPNPMVQSMAKELLEAAKTFKPKSTI